MMNFCLYILLLFSFTILPFNPARAGSWEPPSCFDSLPVIEKLPDLFSFADGKCVRSAKDWERRREEIKQILQYYEYGHLPPRPHSLVVKDLKKRFLSEYQTTQEKMTLVIGSAGKVSMRIALYRPEKAGRLPVIIREEAELGHLEEVPLLIKRGYILVEYAREDLDPDKTGVVGPAQKAYPDYDWATLAVWAWGGMRVVDYLETRKDIDLERIGIVGHSRGGKMALLAGAFDKRFALVAANGSGCGGAGCFRIRNEKSETLGKITEPSRFAYWFHPRLRWFNGKENRLPFDQHFLKALVAPRALICTEAEQDLWANPLGSRITTEQAQKVFDFLGADTKNAFHIRKGTHDLTPTDWRTILDFADQQFYGIHPKKNGDLAE